jgi:hypothetical protein
MAFFVVSTFLLTITNTPNLSNAYGCTNSTNTNHTAGVNGTSGNITKSALTGSSQIFGIAVTSSGHKIGDQGPPQSVYIAFSVPRSGTITTVKPCQGGGTGGGLTAGGGGGGGSYP